MLHRLVLMRHAKSTPASLGMGDHERPLMSKGTHDAHLVGTELKRRNIAPGLIFCSDAKRTKDTWEQVAQSMPPATIVRESPEIYEAPWQNYVTLISRFGQGHSCVMTVGHNPTTEDLIRRLCGQTIEMKPGYAAILELEAESWAEAITKNTWRLADLITC